MNRVLQDELMRTVNGNKDLFTFFSGRTILVTGATGLIGSMLIKSIMTANDILHTNIRVIGHVRNIEKAEAVFEGFRRDTFTITNVNVKDIAEPIDYIVHTASPTQSKFFISNPVETLHTSINQTVECLELSKAQNIKNMVYLSSMEQYGIQYEDYQTMTEDDLGYINHLDTRSSYSEGKRACECYCYAYAKEYGVNVTIARLAQTFGPGVSGDDNRVSIQFAKSALQNKDIVLHTKGESLSNFCYLTDALTGILVLLKAGVSGEAYNICNAKETRSIYDIAKLVAHEVVGGRISVVIDIPETNNYGYAPTVKYYLTADKLQALGWAPQINMKEGYQLLMDYLAQEG